MTEQQVWQADRELSLLGISLRFPVTTEGYGIAEATVEPGFQATAHVHRVHHEVFYVLDGSIDFLVGDETIHVPAGGVLDVPPGVVHDFRNPGPATARMLGLFAPGGLERYFEQMAEHVAAGTFDMDVLGRLREEYDTQHVHIVWQPAAG